VKRGAERPANGAVVYHDVVITASNHSQAKGYEAELALRKRDGRLPEATAFHVVADPGGRRVGSGAATLVVIETLAARYRTTPVRLAEGRRILILHSGGDSRRLPAYAAHGKLFLPLPRADEYGRGVSLFDLLLADLSSLSLGTAGRVVVAAGDDYLSLVSQ
jgi:fucokinase